MTYDKDTIVFEPHPTNPKFIDLTDKVFTRLTVLGYAGKHTGRTAWFCECECDNIIRATGHDLCGQRTKSCKCLWEETRGTTNLSHGETNANLTAEYIAYSSAKGRCTNPNNKKYPRYGGRGIEFRFDSYEDFLVEIEKIGRRPTSQHTLDRIDNDGHYESGNIQWSTPKEQAQHTSTNKLLTIDGVTQCVAAWDGDIKASTIYARVRTGWCHKCAVFNPVHQKCPHI